jgi:AcrR family transcriptional regulator
VARGRPREFDMEEALDAALKVFWRKGYEGASLSDLTEAMGINRPSLYAAFGDKEALFQKVLCRYVEGPAGYMLEALEEPAARRVAEGLLNRAVDLVTDPRNPRGCLLVQGALVCGDTAASVRQELAARRTAAEAKIRARFERAKADGDLSADADPADVARYIVTVMRGIAVQAAGGSSRSELRRVVEMALKAWPKGRATLRCAGK